MVKPEELKVGQIIKAWFIGSNRETVRGFLRLTRVNPQHPMGNGYMLAVWGERVTRDGKPYRVKPWHRNHVIYGERDILSIVKQPEEVR